MKRLIALVLLFAVLLSGCNASRDLMKKIEPQIIEHTIEPNYAAMTDFSVRLFQNALQTGENFCLSPVSVLSALAMTANGANGETLSQMEAVLGQPISVLNDTLWSYQRKLPDEKKNHLYLANAIWFADKDDFTANKTFLQSNANYYGAEIRQATFDDKTIKRINDWVDKETDGMIDQILQQLSEETVMCLINAMAFEGEWQDPYLKTMVRDGVFTTEDGTEQNVEFLRGTYHGYLEDEQATGLIRYYSKHEYAFVALLPKEGISVAEYVATLDGQTLHAMLSEPLDYDVRSAIPKFQMETSIELPEVLEAMGMTNAFDFAKADFSKLGTSDKGNLAIGQVMHKAFIQLDEKGTKAGAASAVFMKEGAAPAPKIPKEVILDRPFVFLLMDSKTCVPFFMGVVMDIGQSPVS